MSDPTPEEARKKAEQEKRTREKMDAFGFKSDDPDHFAEFQKLETKYAAGLIGYQDVLRGMETFHTNTDDKARRDAAKQPEKDQQEQQKDSAGSDRRAADRAAARGKYEQLLQKDSANQVERAAAREAWEKNVAGETLTQTIEQDQNRQRNRDIDRGDKF